MSEENLTNLFAKYGTVTKVSLPTDRETGRVRGFAFVEMGADSEESAAIDALNQTDLLGRVLRVNKASPRTESGSGRSDDRRGGGGYSSGGRY